MPEWQSNDSRGGGGVMVVVVVVVVIGLQDEDEDYEDNIPSTVYDQLKEVLTTVEKVIFVLSIWNMTNHYTLAL